MFNFGRDKEVEDRREGEAQNASATDLETVVQHKTFMEAAMPVFACGAGLFSDGYINNVGDIPCSILALRIAWMDSKSPGASAVARTAIACEGGESD